MRCGAFAYLHQALELRSVLTYKSHVLVAHTQAFSGVTTDDFLAALTGCVPPTDHALHECVSVQHTFLCCQLDSMPSFYASCMGFYKVHSCQCRLVQAFTRLLRCRVCCNRCIQPNSSAVRLFHSLPAVEPLVAHDPRFTAAPEAPLKMGFVMQQIQAQLLGGDTDMAVLVDTGDSMFRTQTLKLPEGTPYEVQVRRRVGNNNAQHTQHPAAAASHLEPLEVASS